MDIVRDSVVFVLLLSCAAVAHGSTSTHIWNSRGKKFVLPVLIKLKRDLKA